MEHTKKMDESDDLPSDSNGSFINPSLIKPLKKSHLNITADVAVTSADISNNQDAQINLKIRKGPAQRLAEVNAAIPYKEPSWGGMLPNQYSLEIIKNGIIFETIKICKSFIIVGRFSTCDIILEHPSISRFHCAIQQKKEEGGDQPPGIYVYDLNSTHGTFQNKHRLKPRMYNRLRVGHMVKFGGSTRMFILQGPEEDQEPETVETASELMALAEVKKKNSQNTVSTKLNERKSSDSNSIDWGMGDDAEEDSDDGNELMAIKNPFATNEELYLDDPKKSLNGWFEREGYDLPSYDVIELKPGVFKASVEIPFPNFGGGQPIVCSIEHRGKKKDTIVQCALEACRTLDKQGLLRKSMHTSHEKKRKNWSENDYYDSDEDEFLDRTGDIEKKRKLRKREIESVKSKIVGVETYESLMQQYKEIIKELDVLENKLKLVDELQTKEISLKGDNAVSGDADELENYMHSLNSQVPDKHKRVAWKLETIRLRKEELRLRKFVNIARPMGTPELPPRLTEYNCGDSKVHSKNIIVRPTFHKDKPTSRIPLVHAAFLEKDEEDKIKLPKVNCDDDSDNVKPIPYSKSQQSIDKYRKLLLLKKRLNKKLGITDDNGENVGNTANSALILHSPEEPLNTYQPIDDVITELEQKPADEALGQIMAGDDVKAMPNVKTPHPSQSCVPQRTLKESTEGLEFMKPTLEPKLKTKTKEAKKTKNKTCFDFEKDYESWVPPAGQTGDGRTHLNEKLGY